MGVLSRHMSKPRKEHWIIEKRVFMYLCGTLIYGLWYEGRIGLERVLDMHDFVDAYLARDLDRRISRSRYVFK
jgi:hypothetical protein